MDRTALMGRLARVVAELAPSRAPLATRLCEACRSLLGADGASLTLSSTTPDRITLAATDDVASRLEDLQDVLGEGPCRTAYDDGRPLVLEFADVRARWPRFAGSAQDALGGGDDHLLVSLPMRPATTVIGVLSAYRTPSSPIALDLAEATFLANAVGVALMRDPEMEAAHESGGAWASRAQVHVATGMVVAQLRIAPEDALAMLRAHAFAHDLTMQELAALVVDRSYDFRQE